MATLAPVLPPVLAVRIFRSAGRDSPGAFLRALPATLAFLGAWTVGEMAGYVAGHGVGHNEAGPASD